LKRRGEWAAERADDRRRVKAGRKKHPAERNFAPKFFPRPTAFRAGLNFAR
jgi:hypothetical protein